MLSLSSYFSQVPSTSHLPTLFLPNPLLFLFPPLLCGGGCWAYATVPLPFPCFQSAPQLCDSHQSDADTMVTGPLRERSSGPPGLYECCRLTEQHSPPPHLDKGSGPRTSTVHTHTHTHLPDPQRPQMNTRRTNIRAKGSRKMSGRASRTETLIAPHRSSTQPRLTFCCSLICLMFSMLWKSSQSNSLFYVVSSFKTGTRRFPHYNIWQKAKWLKKISPAVQF